MKKYLPRPTYANVVASLALFLALCGGAIAATKLPKNSVGSAQLKKGAVTGAKVKKGSLLASSFKSGQLPSGPAGPRGPKGEQGAPGEPGKAGPAGSPWTVGGTLPGGATLKGAYGIVAQASAIDQRVGTGVSFGIPLASGPAQHFIAIGGTPSAACPGNAASPQASPGNLCVYEARKTNFREGAVEDIVTGETGGPTAQPFGVAVVGFSLGSGKVEDFGSWAVTAP